MTPEVNVPMQSTFASAYRAAREPEVSMLAVGGLIEAVAQAGVEREQFLRMIRLEHEQVQRAEERMPLSEVLRFGGLAIEATGDPALGVHWAERLTQSSFAPISHMLSHVHNLRQGFELISKFESLFCDQTIFTLREDERNVTLQVSSWPCPSLAIRHFVAEVIVTGMAVMIRAVRPGGKIVSASFDYAAPAHVAEYKRVIDAEIRFDQPFSGLVLARSVLDAPLPHVNADVYLALKAIAERQLQSLNERTPYTSGLRELMLRRMPKRTSMTTAARALGLSERSLRRQLIAEGTTFRDVEFSALGSVAKWMLRQRKCTIQDVAYELGYADTPTFHRAFKRWTGMTPNDFRNTSD